MTPDDVQQMIDASLSNAQYGVAKVPNHTHDGVNSPNVAIQPVTSGGTGLGTLTAHGVVIGEGTNTVNVTSAGTSGQVLTSNGASADPTFQSVVPSSATQTTFTAAETITVGAAVSATLYQSNLIGYDTSGVSGSASFSITVASNTGRTLNLIVMSTGSIATATYNGIAIGLVFSDNTGGGFVSGLNLQNPSTGTHTLAITLNSGSFINAFYWSLYNTGTFDTGAGAVAASTGISASLTLGVDGAVTLGAITDTTINHSIGTVVGNVYAENTSSSNGTVSTSAHAFGESGVANQYGIGTIMTISTSGASNSSWLAGVLSIAPTSAPVFGVQNASSAASNRRSQAFIGFSNSSVTAGQSVAVTTAGVASSGLSGIDTGSQYYLNDTNGTIGTAAGSVTRKVGIGTSDNTLLITNIW